MIAQSARSFVAQVFLVPSYSCQKSNDLVPEGQ